VEQRLCSSTPAFGHNKGADETVQLPRTTVADAAWYSRNRANHTAGDSIIMQRRHLLEIGFSAIPLATLGLGALLPTRARSAVTPHAWPESAFHAEAVDAAIADLFGDRAAEDSMRITLTAPDIAENGRVVPVEVETDLPGVETMTILCDGNPYPLLARAHVTPAVAPRVSIRVKMGQSSNLIALVEAEGKLYRATRAVKVTAGGCGG
jgi:sulfur-oxidizing protein SoxY